MEITRSLVAGAMGLALIVGGVGCGQAAEKAAEAATERAIEENGGCEDVDVDADGSFSGTCGGTDIEADGDGDVSVESEDGGVDVGSGADLPEGWPADLAVVEGLNVLFTTADELGLNVTGSIDGDLDVVADGIRADLEAGGFTIDTDESGDEDDGRRGINLVATGAEHTATIALNETPDDPRGSIGVAYLLTPLAG